MAEALLEKETLNYDDVEALLGPPPFGKKHLVSPVDYENQLKKQGEFGKETQSIWIKGQKSDWSLLIHPTNYVCEYFHSGNKPIIYIDSH